MECEEATLTWSRSVVNKPEGAYHLLETPIRLRRLAGSNNTDFSGFENEKRGTMRRIVNVEREIRFMKELLEGLMMKYEQTSNKERKSMFCEYEHIIETNKEMQKELMSIKEENEVLKFDKCVNY